MSKHTEKTSIRRNVLASYVAQLYVSFIGIFMAPFYISYMGTEAYGLIGFFTMMAMWFQLLDMGLTPTLLRETARFRGGAISAEELRAFLRVLEGIFGAVSFVGGVALAVSSTWISTHWLKADHLPAGQVTAAVMLMGLAAPFRWVSGIYRGVMNGFEQQVWLGTYDISITTVRFVGVLGVLVLVDTTPKSFFAYQLVVAMIELAGLVIKTYGQVRTDGKKSTKFSFSSLRRTLGFSLTIAFTATAAIVVSQVDKLMLSTMLSLEQFGVFSIAIAAAGAINSVYQPFGQALMPRLTKLVAEGDTAALATLYRQSTQVVCTLLAPAVVTVACFAEPILWSWTGKPELAHQAAPILALYAIGNGWIGLSAFAYYLQYAHGDMRLHLIGNVVLSAILIPLLFVATKYFGAFGSGTVLAGLYGAYALGWVPVIHARIWKGQHWHWMVRDILPIIVPTVLAGVLLKAIVPWPDGRWATLSVCIAMAGSLLGVATASSSVVRMRAVVVLQAAIPAFARRQSETIEKE